MRRMSFDFTSLKQPRGSSPTSPGFPPGTGMQRSQSLWTHKVSAGRKLAESADKLGNLQEPMSERQRALNVKRARKMTQVRSVSCHLVQIWALTSRTKGFWN
jgi:hypothetical protein